MPKGSYSPKQKRLARIAAPRDKITGADLAMLRKKRTLVTGGAKKQARG